MYPATIIEQQIPLLDGSFIPSSGSNTNPVANSDAEAPTTHVDKAFPPANIAQETISQSLNTETKRILGEYAFESLGAIKIGSFQQGISGEIDISPDGITGKNVNGQDTFALNGATGDGIFFGTVKAAGFDIADTTGLISLNNFKSGQVFTNTSLSTTSTSLVDVAGSSLAPFTLTRDTKVLVVIMGYGRNSDNIISNGASYGELVMVDTNIADQPTNLFMPGQATTYTPDGLSFTMSVGNLLYTAAGVIDRSAGVHTFKLQYHSINGGTTFLSAFEIAYILLGN